MIASTKIKDNSVIKLLLTILLVTGSVISSHCQNLHLYGGKDQDVYLGCINCSKYDANSIWNENGTYGNQNNENSIWNKNGTYGNENSLYSPWNNNTTSKFIPVVVDKEGKFYGYFTVNPFNSKRANFGLALNIYQHHDFIRDNLSAAYDIIFKIK